ncbi:hypothetical protein K438DRAFT_1984062 [Mycena galopus ATCC 62051]|nr:hypothetical protein K438DRAFT_1984062 [Mycena galopus ATCC 62051]
MHNPIERETYKQQLTSNETTLEVLKGYKPKLHSSSDFASMIVQLSAGHASAYPPLHHEAAIVDMRREVDAAWTLFEEADAGVEREKRRYLLSGLESAAAGHEDLQRGKTEIRFTFSEAGVFVLVSVSVCAAWRVRTGDDGDMALDGTVAAIAGRHPGRWPPEAQRSFQAAALLSQLPAALPPLNASPPLDEGEASSSEEDTKKSFDWTGELRNFSVAPVSSYGHVTNPGVNDPFEYGLPMPSLRERPSSEDLSVTMSLNVDDTFSCPDPPQRIRVASDTSSFYFKAPTQPSGFYNYNRSFGNPALSKNDTSTSGSSLAHHSVDMRADGAGWDDERGIVALRRYYVLRYEAEDTVTESERTWSDTPFSVYALQAFQPPKNPEDMQVLLQHSVRTTAHCRRSWDRAECARGPSRQAQRPSQMTCVVSSTPFIFFN